MEEKDLETKIKDLKEDIKAERRYSSLLGDALINITEYLRSKTRSKKNKQILDLIDNAVYRHH